jgi:hypothetical protein
MISIEVDTRETCSRYWKLTPLRAALAAALACLEPLDALEAPPVKKIDASASALGQNSQNLLLLSMHHHDAIMAGNEISRYELAKQLSLVPSRG